MDRLLELRKCYGRLKAFAGNIPEGPNVSAAFARDYANIYQHVQALVEEPLSGLAPQDIRVWTGGSGTTWCDAGEVRSRAQQLLGLLEFGYSLEDKALEVGSLFKAIHDLELQERCGDLLTGSGPFDRVINQATLVLEDRLRRRANLGRDLYGPGLVNAAVKSDPTQSKIVMSLIPSEQEGYANIIRGLMLALRNETHHTVVDTFTREDALSVCGFIDRILRLIDQSGTN